MRHPFFALALLASSAHAQETVTPASEPGPVGTRLLDLDGDGALDLLECRADGGLLVRRNVGPRSFVEVRQELPAVRVSDVLLSDLDGDGRLDLYLVGPQTDVALVGLGGGAFREATEELGLGESGHGLSAERRDVDADGLLDLVVHNRGSDVLFWARADGRFEREARTSDGLGLAALPGTLLVDPRQEIPGEEPTSDAVGSGGRRSLAGPPGASAGHLGAAVAPSPTSSTLPLMGLPINFDAFYVNDNQNEVDSADVVDGSLTGADISTVSGNVGIGTTTPSAKLDVVGNMQVDGSTLFIDSTNNRVGIGTTTPTSRLDARSGAPISNILPGALDAGSTVNVIGRDALLEVVGEQVGSTSAAFGLKELDPSGAHVSTWGLVRNTGVSGALKFTNGTNVSLGANPTLMTLTAAGSVGIGTTAPNSKLTVNGQIETLSGGVKFPDGSVQTKAAPGTASSQFLRLSTGSWQVFGSDGAAHMDNLRASILLGDNGTWVGGSGGWLVAPLHLPAGAQVLSITAHVYDTWNTSGSNTDLQVNIQRKLNTNGDVVEVVFTVPAGAVGNFSHTFVGGPLISATDGYYVVARPLLGFPSDGSLRLQNLVIEWIMP